MADERVETVGISASLTIDEIKRRLPECRQRYGSLDQLARAVGIPRRTMCRALGMASNASRPRTTQQVARAFQKLFLPDGSLAPIAVLPKTTSQKKASDFYPLLSALIASMDGSVHALAELMKQGVRLRPHDKLALARLITILTGYLDSTSLAEATQGLPITRQMLREVPRATLVGAGKERV